jgi:hypothetical protein
VSRRPEYTTHSWACKDCGAYQYEARVPKDRVARDYAPTFCMKCGGIQMSERIKGAKCA